MLSMERLSGSLRDSFNRREPIAIIRSGNGQQKTDNGLSDMGVLKKHSRVQYERRRAAAWYFPLIKIVIGIFSDAVVMTDRT
jgi:hypothetical protein